MKLSNVLGRGAQALRSVKRRLFGAPARPARAARPPVLESLEERAVMSGLANFAPAVGFGAAATGGRGGPVVVADTADEFRTFAQRSGPLVIRVQGVLDVGSVSVSSNKTVVGDGNDGLIGEVRLNNVQNVILQNLSFSNPRGAGGGDAIRMTGARNVWVDHANVFDAPDGLIDITGGSDLVTVSWTKFSYTAADPPEHNFAMLIGASDTDVGDRGKLRVTLHHNWWSDRIKERMPRARFGDVHVFNNYFNSVGNNYAIRAAIESEVLVENNSFERVRNPQEVLVTTGVAGRIQAKGNLYVSTTGTRTAGSVVFTPPYAYRLDSASAVKSVVTSGAGAKTVQPMFSVVASPAVAPARSAPAASQAPTPVLSLTVPKPDVVTVTTNDPEVVTPPRGKPVAPGDAGGALLDLTLPTPGGTGATAFDLENLFGKGV